MSDRLAIVPNPMLAGMKRAVTEDGKTFQVPPAWYELMLKAETDAEREALMQSLKVVNLGPPQHDAQWHKDTLEINMARLGGMLKPDCEKGRDEW